MKFAYKVVLVNIAIAIMVSLTVSASSGGFQSPGDFAFGFGVVCLGLGLLNLFIGFIMLVSNSPEWRNGFFLSGAALLLLSGISCGGGVMNL